MHLAIRESARSAQCACLREGHRRLACQQGHEPRCLDGHLLEYRRRLCRLAHWQRLVRTSIRYPRQRAGIFADGADHRLYRRGRSAWCRQHGPTPEYPLNIASGGVVGSHSIRQHKCICELSGEVVHELTRWNLPSRATRVSEQIFDIPPLHSRQTLFRPGSYWSPEWGTRWVHRIPILLSQTWHNSKFFNFAPQSAGLAQLPTPG